MPTELPVTDTLTLGTDNVGQVTEETVSCTSCEGALVPPGPTATIRAK